MLTKPAQTPGNQIMIDLITKNTSCSKIKSKRDFFVYHLHYTILGEAADRAKPRPREADGESASNSVWVGVAVYTAEDRKCKQGERGVGDGTGRGGVYSTSCMDIVV